MGKTIVQNRVATNQATFQATFTKDGEMDSFESFIDDVIREYGKPTTNDYTLSAHKLDPNILRLFIHYILEEEELDDLSENPSLYNTYIKEYMPNIQEHIDSRTQQVFKDAMEEMGYHLSYNRINGEQQYI